MGALPRNEKLTFLKPSTRRQTVTVVSDVGHWISHWDVQRRQSRRCGGPQCRLCSAGLPKQFRYVALVVDQTGSQKLVEFRDRHYDMLERMRNQPGGCVGTVLTIRKEGDANNSPVSICVTGKEGAIKQDITRLIECLGLPAVFMNEEIQQEDATVDNQVDDRLEMIAARFNMTDQPHSKLN